MKKLALVFVLALGILLYSCGKEASQMKQAFQAAQKVAEASKNIADESKLAEARRQERVKKGDTLAMHYTELQKFLPASINGYKAEDPQGTSMNSAGFSYSDASRRYTMKNPDGSESYITIELLDYNQAEGLYTGLTAIWATGLSMENDQKIEKTYKPGIDNVVGFESFDKKNKNAELDLGIAWRFFLKIQADNQSGTDFIKNLANSMNLRQLASM